MLDFAIVKRISQGNETIAVTKSAWSHFLDTLLAIYLKFSLWLLWSKLTWKRMTNKAKSDKASTALALAVFSDDFQNSLA
jgi:hypothetical protein